MSKSLAFKGIFLIKNLGLIEKKFKNSNSELAIIHAEKAKKIIETTGPLKFVPNNYCN